MYFDSTELYTKQIVRQEFDRNHRSGVFRQVWSKITGQSYSLLNVHEIESNLQNKGQNYSGLQSVPISQILGSEGKSSDFDLNWRPLKTMNRHRWMNIALANANGVTMPAVDLLKVGDIYYVRDGHHRISVAKSQGQLEIEANVLSWHSEKLFIKDDNANAQAVNSAMRAPAVRDFLQAAGAMGRQIISALAGSKLSSISRISATEA
ncbi:MAG: hypothetical protein AAF702_16700 [Chloroflexota bacterium]